jgi:hypothetical protein
MARETYRVVPVENGFIVMRGDLFSRDGGLDQQWVAASAEDAGALLTSLLAGRDPGDARVRQQMRMAATRSEQHGPVLTEALRGYGQVGGDSEPERRAQYLRAVRHAADLRAGGLDLSSGLWHGPAPSDASSPEAWSAWHSKRGVADADAIDRNLSTAVVPGS